MAVLNADHELMTRLATSRDHATLSEIVQRHGPTVRAAAFDVLRNSAAAEDVSQEAFLRLVQSPYPPQRSLAGWLRRVARQLAIDLTRQEAARRRREVSRAVPREANRWHEIAPLLEHALADTPAWARALLEAHYYQGRSLRTLAAERGVSPATMCRQMQACVEELRKCLRKNGVLVAGGLLATLLAGNAATAAMVATGTAGAAGVLSLGAVAAGTGAVTVGTICIAIGSGAVRLPSLAGPLDAASTAATKAAVASVENVIARQVAARTPFIYIPAGLNTDPARIRLFERPTRTDGRCMTVIYADLHSDLLPCDQARARIEKQTGRTIEALIPR